MQFVAAKKMKSNKKIFILALTLIFVCFLVGVNNYEQLALAINPVDYNKSDGSDLTRDNWNMLDEDFVKREGDTISGDLSLGSNQITNVDTNFLDNNSIASVNFVNNVISGAVSSGAGTFINWGREDCPTDTVRLYYGYGYNTHYQYRSGGSNSLCIRGGDAGSFFNNASSDSLYPLLTAGSLQIPDSADDPQSTMQQNSTVRCAVCLKRNSICIERIGSWNCNGVAGFSPVYSGYVLGMTENFNQHYTERLCVNRSFQASTIATVGSVLYGTRIQSEGNIAGYTANLNRFLKCSVCCN